MPAKAQQWRSNIEYTAFDELDVCPSKPEQTADWFNSKPTQTELEKLFSFCAGDPFMLCFLIVRYIENPLLSDITAIWFGVVVDFSHTLGGTNWHMKAVTFSNHIHYSCYS